MTQILLATKLLSTANSATYTYSSTASPTPSSTPTQPSVNTPVDWSQFNDSVLILVQRPKGNLMGNTVCTGVIIHPRVVITTAHCADEATSMTVVFDVENGTSAIKKETVAGAQIIIHPDYHPKESLYKADLAVLLLKNPAPLAEKFIRKIPTKDAVHAGDRLQRLGVGARNGKNLRNVTDPIYFAHPGKGIMETSDFYSSFGDSGGPVYTRDHQLLGVHSTIDDFDGKKTPHAFAVYLPDYHDWIQAKIKVWVSHN